jgi:hypothetical protein
MLMVMVKLTDLDPHFLRPVSKVDYEHTDDIRQAKGLQMRCPACHWVNRRMGKGEGHVIMIWQDPAKWYFAGHGYADLSLVAARTPVGLTAGACRAKFYISDGKVDFY